MVDGIRMIFSKDKMIARVTAEGRADMLDDKVMAIMDNLDGQEVTSACWNRQVMGDDVYSCIGKDGSTYDVAACDCIGG